MLKYINDITKNDLKILTFFIQAKFSKYVYFFPIFGSFIYFLFFQNLVFTRINDNKVSVQLIRRTGLIVYALQIINFFLAIFLFVFSMALGFLDRPRWDILSISFLVISCFLFSFSPFLNFICIFWNKFYLQKIVNKILSLKTFDKNEVIMEDEEQINDYKKWINNVFHSDTLIYKSQLFTQDLSMPKKRSIEDFQKKHIAFRRLIDDVHYYYSKKFLKYRITLLCIYINNALKIQNIKTIPFKKVILLNTILSLMYWLVFIGICLCLILIPAFTYDLQWLRKIANDNFKKAIVFNIFFHFLVIISVSFTLNISLKLFHVWFGKVKKQLLMKMIYKSIDKWNKTNNI